MSDHLAGRAPSEYPRGTLAKRSPTPAVAAPRSSRWTVASFVLLAPAAWYAFAPLDRSATPREIGAAFRSAHDPSARSSAPSARQFVDATRELGVAFQHDNAHYGEYRLPEEMGPGVGWIDFDGDGDLDLFVAGGGALYDEGAEQRCRLLRNDRTRFTDVSDEVGAAVRGHAYGVAVADWDDDGDEDLLVTRLGPTVLLRNDGGRFTDISAQSGAAHGGFGSSAAFLDFDRDGRLDFVVGRYMDWKRGVDPECFGPSGERDFCDPTKYGIYAQTQLYRNLGEGRFEDVTARAGVAQHDNQTLGVLASDFDGDGWTDLYLAEDSTAAKLWRNRGDGTFVESALAAGCAFDGRGQAIAGMGVACEDLDGDGRTDLLVSNIRGQSHLALLNSGGHFRDASNKLGVTQWSTGPTGFGLVLFDADLDGEFDGYVANGAVSAPSNAAPNANPYAERDQFFGWRGGRFVDRSAEAGALGEGVGRAVALADFDEDGDVDLAVANNGGPLLLLRNAQDGGAWLSVDVRTSKGAPAVGARVEIVVAGRTQRREVRPQSSYLASHDPRAHFGLGGATAVERVLVTWPDGARWSADTVPARTRLRVSRDQAQEPPK